MAPSRPPRQRPSRRVSQSLELEPLEDRNVPSINTPFDVSTSTLFDSGPATASSNNGQRVVVWVREDPDDGNSNDIIARLFSNTGVQIGSDIIVANSNDDEFDPDVAMDDSGNFVVVWTDDFNNSGDLDVVFALFNNAGTQVKFDTVDNNIGIVEDSPSVGMSDSGRFVVSWRQIDSGNHDVFAQRFNAAGEEVGNRILVAAKSNRIEFGPSIDVAGDGKFAVAYLKEDANDPDLTQIFAATYAANGTLSHRAKIDTEGDGDIPVVDVAIRNNGGVVVVYQKENLGSGLDIIMRKMSAGGVVGGRKALADTNQAETAPRVAINRTTGEFVLSYLREDAGSHVIVSEFLKDGTLATDGEHDLGVGNVAAGISVNASDLFFVAFETILSASDHNIDGAFGTLTP